MENKSKEKIIIKNKLINEQLLSCLVSLFVVCIGCPKLTIFPPSSVLTILLIYVIFRIVIMYILKQKC